jgi:hypothetical protein
MYRGPYVSSPDLGRARAKEEYDRGLSRWREAPDMQGVMLG